MASASLCLVAFTAACTPTVPAGPKVIATVSLSTTPSMPGLVQLSALASGFKPGQFSPNYDAEWVAYDAVSGVVASSTSAIGNGDGTLVVTLQPGLFTPTINGSTATIRARFDVTMHRGGSTASRSTSITTLTWTMPTNPITGSLTADNSYQVQQGYEAVCSPVGTDVHVVVSGETSSAYAGFIDMTVPFGSNFVGIGQSNDVTLTTTTECWSLVVGRASFTGGLTGTMTYNASWEPLAD